MKPFKLLWNLLHFGLDALSPLEKAFASVGISLAEKMGDALITIVTDAVRAAENTPGTGKDKFDAVKNAVVGDFNAAKEAFSDSEINQAIENAVAVVKTPAAQ